MPRAPRVKQAGFYHVINRGVERRVVFYEEEDFEKFLEILAFGAEIGVRHLSFTRHLSVEIGVRHFSFIFLVLN